MAVVGDMETVTGFSLVGVKHVHVHEGKEETISKINSFLSSEDIGLILLTYSVAGELGRELEEKLKKKGILPVVLQIPDRTGSVPESDELSELIKRTVGSDIVVKPEDR